MYQVVKAYVLKEYLKNNEFSYQINKNFFIYKQMHWTKVIFIEFKRLDRLELELFQFIKSKFSVQQPRLILLLLFFIINNNYDDDD